jgi:hypothetical protein
MGKIKQGILGGFRGKVGTVVGTSWKGIAVMKGRPLSVANPKSPAQVNNRNRNTAILQLGQAFGTSFIREFWNKRAKEMTGFNMFMSINSEGYNPSLSAYVAAKIFASQGSLGQTTITTGSSGGGSSVNLTFTAWNSSPKYLSTDVMHVVWFDTVSKQGGIYENASLTASSVNFSLGFTPSVGSKLLFARCVRRADSSDYSDAVTKEVTW